MPPKLNIGATIFAYNKDKIKKAKAIDKSAHGNLNLIFIEYI